MNLQSRIRELEKKYPAMRGMEVECTFADGSTAWITVDQLAGRPDFITFTRCRHSTLPGLDKLLQIMKEAACET